MSEGIQIRMPTPPDGALRDCEKVSVTKSEEYTNTYTLADKTVVSFRAIVTEVWKVIGQYDADGNPQYILKSGNVVTVTVPEALRRKTS